MWREVPISPIFRELEKDDLLPAIIFRTSRAQCDRDVETGGKSKFLKLSDSKQREIKKAIADISARYEMDKELVFSHPQYKTLLNCAIGAHHAGQLLAWRLMLEELMAAGLLRVLVATGTVAAGVDFPARTVVVTAHSKRGAEGYNDLTATEFQQMSGRAGRRGKDQVGYCVVAPSAFCDSRVIAPLAKKSAEPLRSAYFPSASTVLNLLRYRNVDGLRFTVARSLAAYDDKQAAEALIEQSGHLLAQLPAERAKLIESSIVDGGEAEENNPDESSLSELSKDERKARKTVRRLRRQASEREQQQSMMLERALKGLRDLGYVDGESLSEKGYWAANLCTNLVLELGEIIESGLLKSIHSERLIGIVAAISADSYRQYLSSREDILNPEDVQALEGIVERVSQLEMPGSSDDRSVVTDAAYTAVIWYRADDWHSFRSLLLLSGSAEGDAARLITQTAEHLQQLSRLRNSSRNCDKSRGS